MSLLPRPATLPSNAQLSALLDGVDDALLLLVDQRQRISYRNPVAQRLLGCEAGQTLEQALAWLDAAGRQRLVQALVQAPAQAPQTGQPLVVDVALADGPLRGQRLAPVRHRGGQPRLLRRRGPQP